MATIIGTGRSLVRTLLTWNISGPAVQVGDSHALQRVHDETGHIQIEVPDPSLVFATPVLFVIGTLTGTTSPAFVVFSRSLDVQPESEIILNVRMYPVMVAFINGGATLFTPVKITMQE